MSGPWVLPEELRQLGESDDGLVKEVLAVFRSDTADRIGKLRGALERDDRGQAQRQAHTIKGAAAQVGAFEVSALAREIEQQAAGGEAAALAGLVARLESAFAGVCQEITASL
jgi:HPt (histidine-containing phosphotransfer) domain-containing protein